MIPTKKELKDRWAKPFWLTKSEYERAISDWQQTLADVEAGKFVRTRGND